jgi:MarR family transcriptional regulator, 2-MHQ and catechol-resistance regulon repressor
MGEREDGLASADLIPSDDVTLELNSVFVGIMRTTNKRGEAFTAGFSLTPARVAVISILYRFDRPLTVGEIATGLHVSSTNISRRLDGLERSGWVQRERNPGDGRSIYVSLTDWGRSQADAIMPVIYHRLNNVWSCFDYEEKKHLVTLLNRFFDHLQTSPDLAPSRPE